MDLIKSPKSHPAWNKGLTKSDPRVAKYASKLKGIQRPTGENHPRWKGDKVGYGGVHIWMHKHFGKATLCEDCHCIDAKKYEWANISQTYLRDRSDWKQLCSSCHKKFDYKLNGHIPWNKGKKLGFIPKGVFKKGLTPWNKGLTKSDDSRIRGGRPLAQG